MPILTKLVGSNFNLFSLRLLQNDWQMPTKWILKACTSRRSINQLETLHECNFKKYLSIQLTAHLKLVFNIIFTLCCLEHS